MRRSISRRRSPTSSCRNSTKGARSEHDRLLRGQGDDHPDRGDISAGLPSEGAVSGVHRRDLSAEHEHWLAPNHYDPATGKIKLSVHSWLLQIGGKKILIDACCGNNKVKPDAAVVAHAQHALSRAARRRRRAAGRDRSRDVHAPASRSCRLEHAAEGRPVGADFPNARYVFSKPDVDYFPKVDADPKDGAGRVRHVPRMRAAGDRGRARRPGERRTVPAQRLIEIDSGARPFAGPCVLQAGERRRSSAAFIGDVFHHLLQVYYPHWNFPKNSDAEQARVSRRKVLEHCASSGALVFPGHVGAPFAGRIEARKRATSRISSPDGQKP